MKKLLILILIPIVLYVAPVFAQGDICNSALPPELGGCGTGEDGANIIGRLLARFFAAALASGAIIFLLYLVYGAYKWLMSGGDKAALQTAQSTMTQAVIGLVLLASVFAIGRIVGQMLGLQCEGVFFPDVICWPTIPVS